MKSTKAQAKELSIKKWEYIVGNNGNDDGLIEAHPELAKLWFNCGYCEKYIPFCRNCPINLESKKYNKDKFACANKLHPWSKWEKNSTKSNAQKVLDLIRES